MKKIKIDISNRKKKFSHKNLREKNVNKILTQNTAPLSEDIVPVGRGGIVRVGGSSRGGGKPLQVFGPL